MSSALAPLSLSSSFLQIALIFRQTFPTWFLSSVSLHHPKINLRRKTASSTKLQKHPRNASSCQGWGHLLITGPILMAQEMECSDWLGWGHVLILGTRESISPTWTIKAERGKGYFLQNFWTRKKRKEVHCPPASWTFSTPNLWGLKLVHAPYPFPPPNSSQLTLALFFRALCVLVVGTEEVLYPFSPLSRSLYNHPSLSESSKTINSNPVTHVHILLFSATTSNSPLAAVHLLPKLFSFFTPCLTIKSLKWWLMGLKAYSVIYLYKGKWSQIFINELDITESL